MEAIPVTLIVKAPNQQFEDQTIQCELSWTIKRLKGYLSEVYPCKPSSEEQKLIYSGQLLNDGVVLKDVLRQYEGQETHTVHLVYTPKSFKRGIKYKSSDDANKSSASSTSTASTSSQSSSGQSTSAADGLRRRTTTGPITPSTQQPAQSIPATAMPQAPQYAIPQYLPYMTAFPQQPQAPNVSQQDPNSTQESIIAQQMAIQQTMHQMYLQYWNFYNASMGATAGYQPMAFLPPTANVDQATYQNPQPAAGVQVQALPQPPPQPQVQPQQNDDENENRDWLEIFYTLSRLIVLLSLVYFYSSPIRCSIVIFVMILYYFYHTQRLRRLQEEANQLQQQPAEPAPAENVAVAAEENINEIAQPIDEEVDDAAVPLIENPNQPSPGGTPANADDDNNRLPMIALLRTFVLSFFTSLIPETPAV